MSFTKKTVQDKSQPVIMQQQPSQKQYSKDVYKNNLVNCSSSAQQNFFLSLGSGDIPYDKDTPTILWTYNIPVLVNSQKKRIIQIINCSAFLKHFSSCDFPSKIGLKIRDVTGFAMLKYLKPSGQTPDNPKWITVSTNICCWSIVKQMNSNQTPQTGIRTYNVVYQNQQNLAWDIGMMNTLVFSIVDQNGVQIPGPFNNPVQLQFRIIHVGL